MDGTMVPDRVLETGILGRLEERGALPSAACNFQSRGGAPAANEASGLNQCIEGLGRLS